ncbi:hypothetical protein HDU98_001122 [Podochytrium sp. JEL0797]|nr:hypothetical protein HDU98_001122 [Podochytrium sp. JEL0797]
MPTIQTSRGQSIQGEVSEASVTVGEVLSRAAHSLGLGALVVAHTAEGLDVDLDAPAMGLGSMTLFALTADEVFAIPASLRAAFSTPFCDAELHRFAAAKAAEPNVARRSSLFSALKGKRSQRRGSNDSSLTPPSGGTLFSASDLQNALGRLKKKKRPTSPSLSAAPKAPELSAEEKARAAKQADDETRSSLFIELLGYMETSHGNLEELTNNASKSTRVSRGFIYSLIRRDFVEGFRLIESMPEKGSKAPLQVYQGIEVNRSISLKDVHDADLKEQMEHGGIVARVHMYRFDDKAQSHTLDEIVLMKGVKFPKPIPPFNEPEPVKDSSSKASLMAWDAWKQKKDDFPQLDYPQFELSFKKLMDQEKVTVLQMQKLEQTQIAMRRMAESLSKQFEKFPTEEVRVVVEAIPKHIKELTRKLQEERGIILRGEGLKLTPDFLKTLDLKPKAVLEAEKALAIAAAEEARQRAEEAKQRAVESEQAAAAAAESPVVFTYKSFLEKAKDGNVEDLLREMVESDLAHDEEAAEVKSLNRLHRLKTFHAGVFHRTSKYNEL